MTYTRAMLDALEIDAEVATYPGNVAAHAVNITEGGMAGMNIGWKDQENTTNFVVYIVDSIDELIQEEGIDGMDADDRLSGIADSAVPIYNSERIEVAVTLGAEVDDIGLLDPNDMTLASVAGVALYEYATQMVYAIARAVGEAVETIIDDAIDGDLCRVVDANGTIDHGAGCPAGDWNADDDVVCQHVANGEKPVNPFEVMEAGTVA